MKDDLENKADEPIIKEKTEISCDNITCEAYGDMWLCYKGKERCCGIYREWERNSVQ